MSDELAGETSVSILYLSSSEADRQTFIHEMQDAGNCRIDSYLSVTEAVDHLRRKDSVDCIVSDHSLPDLDGVAFLETVRAQYPELPFILFTETGDEELASRAISARVTDYLVRPQVQDQWEELWSLIERSISFHRSSAKFNDSEFTAKSVFQAAPHPMAVVRDHGFTYVNGEFLELVGADSTEDLEGVSPASRFRGESVDLSPDTFADIQRGEQVLEQLEQDVVGLDGSASPADVTAAAIRWNQEPAVLLICRDISDRQERQTQLSRFRQAIEQSGHAVYITDTDGTIEYVNEAFEEITGYVAEEAIGSNPRILKSGNMPDGYYEELWETVKRGEVWEETVTNRRKSGELYHAHQTIAPVSGPNGDITAYVAIQTDITDQKEREQELHLYRQAIQNSTDLLAAADSDHNLLFANSKYRAFHGLPLDADLSDVNLQEIMDQEEFADMKPYLNRVLDGERVSYEMERQTADGEERTLNVQYYPLHDEAGEIIGDVAAMRDVTEKRELTENIRELSEYRRVVTKVNNTVMRAESPSEALPAVTEAISSSHLFGCSFIVMLDDLEPSFVCSSESSLEKSDVAEFHTAEYVENVFEDEILFMEDVTTEPFKQHISDSHPHGGMALPLTYEDERLGVLTVHLPPDTSFEEVKVKLLAQLSDDLALYLHNHTLERGYRTFQEIAERIDDPIMLQDRDGKFQVVNDAVAQYSGLSKQELAGNDEFLFMDSETAEYVQDMKERAISTEEPVRYTVNPDLPTKGDRSFSTVRYPHFDDSGNIDGTVAICRDVTDLKEHQRQMQVMDRVLRHNVNNDMTVIEGFAEAIRTEVSEELATEYADKIIDHSSKLINTLQKERKITAVLSNSPDKMDIDLAAVVQKTVANLQHTLQNATVKTSTDTACRVTGTDAISEAVEELLRNAIIHSPDDDPTVEISVRCGPETGTVRIVDRNPVIPEMEREVLRGNSEIGPLFHGSGLGLWLVNHIVRDADGFLRFEANEPQGNIVAIHLPRATDQ